MCQPCYFEGCGLASNIDKCTGWGPLRNQLNLRFQNLPGEDGMFQVVLRMIFLTQSTAIDPLNELFDNFSMLTRQLLNDLPAPSEFAQPLVWPKVQETTPILCLRPPNARGRPLTTLHHVFRRFQYELSRPLPMTTKTVAVQIAASKLCFRMG